MHGRSDRGLLYRSTGTALNITRENRQKCVKNLWINDGAVKKCTENERQTVKLNIGGVSFVPWTHASAAAAYQTGAFTVVP